MVLSTLFVLMLLLVLALVLVDAFLPAVDGVSTKGQVSLRSVPAHFQAAAASADSAARYGARASALTFVVSAEGVSAGEADCVGDASVMSCPFTNPLCATCTFGGRLESPRLGPSTFALLLARHCTTCSSDVASITCLLQIGHWTKLDPPPLTLVAGVCVLAAGSRALPELVRRAPFDFLLGGGPRPHSVV